MINKLNVTHENQAPDSNYVVNKTTVTVEMLNSVEEKVNELVDLANKQSEVFFPEGGESND